MATREQLLALRRTAGRPDRATSRVLDALIGSAPAWIERLDQLPFDRRRVPRLRRAIGYRLERLRG